MGPKTALHSTKPAVRGFLLLALATIAMSIAVTTLRKPEREGWIALPPQPMDATDPDIRDLLSKSVDRAPSRNLTQEGSLSERCGEDDTEADTIPAGQKASRPIAVTPNSLPPSSPVQPPLPTQRYLMVIDGPSRGQATRRVQIDIEGEQALVRVSDGDMHSSQLAPPSAPGEPPPSLRYNEKRLPLSALASLREVWQAPELWSANQRSGVWCADRNGLRQAFFEACVHGRYYARDRACDRNAQEPLAELWKRVVELTPPPPAREQ